MIFILGKYILKYLRVYGRDIGSLFSEDSGKNNIMNKERRGGAERGRDEAKANQQYMNQSPEYTGVFYTFFISIVEVQNYYQIKDGLSPT